MIQFKEVPFNFEGGDYKIKVFYDDSLINILTFRNNYPSNGFRLQIKIPKTISVKKVLEQDVIDQYVEICKRDITERRWERFIGIASNKK